jgi:hypothetical protein
VWPWAVPLGLSLLVFVAVLVSTPPGFGAFAALLGGALRGIEADAAAYALGAAASLALLTLGLAALTCLLVARLVTRA